MFDNELFIQSQLREKGFDFRESTNRRDFLLKCPFHEHSGTKYKLAIKKDGSAVHCWVCGWSGTWNKLAKTLGMQPLEQEFAQLKARLVMEEEPEPQFVELPKIEPLAIKLPRFGNGPDLPKKFLKEFHAHSWYDPISRADRILFEVLIPDLVGWFALRVDQLTLPKQRNMKGRWVKNKALFPLFHPLVQSKTIVLVEGPFDALRLIYEGIPAISIFGTGNWSRYKRNLLITKYRNFVLAFDGDDAGRLCSSLVYDDLKDLSTVKIFEFNDGEDPGNTKDIEKIKAII